MRYLSEQIISLSDLTTSQTSSAIDAQWLWVTTYQTLTTGTYVSGTIYIDGSNDIVNVEAGQQPTNWFNLGSTSVSSIGLLFSSQFLLCYRQIRFRWESATSFRQKIAPLADVAGSLNNKYFFVNSANNAVQYYVWINVGGTGTDPLVAGKVGIEIDISANASVATVANAIGQGLQNSGSFEVIETTSTYVTYDTIGQGLTTTPASDHNTGFTFSTLSIAGTFGVSVFAHGM